MTKPVHALILVGAVTLWSAVALAQQLPDQIPTPEQLAEDNALFLTVARKALPRASTRGSTRKATACSSPGSGGPSRMKSTRNWGWPSE